MPGYVGSGLRLCCSTWDQLTSQGSFVTLVTRRTMVAALLSPPPPDEVAVRSGRARPVPHQTVRPSMSSTPTGTPIPADAMSEPTVLTGTPVVPGVAVGPVVRPVGAVELPTGPGPVVPED